MVSSALFPTPVELSSTPNTAQVLLPLYLKANYTYRLAPHYARQPAVGKRVLVPFGEKNKLYAGVITALNPTGQAPQQALKTVEEVLDDEPVLTQVQLQLFDWIADYYLCGAGEVLKAALPAGLKMESETALLPVEGWEQAEDLADREYLLLEALSVQGALTLQEAAKLLGLKNPKPVLLRLANLGLLLLQQEAQPRYTQRTVRCLALNPPYDTPTGLPLAFEQVKLSPRQEAVLLVVAEANFKQRLLTEKEVLARVGVGAGVPKALVNKGVLRYEELPVDRLAALAEPASKQPVQLTPAQQAALQQVQQSFTQAPGKPVLLHGVTGAGKTHIYLALIQQAVAAGKQVLYLLPEIALTKQIIEKIKAEFGQAVGVYHSRFNPPERVEIWQKVLSGEYQVVIGVRSAMLLPFDNLGLIVVDEEHDASFKQQEPAPRYHARDVAIYYAHQFRCNVLLGSATPSLESWENAQRGKYSLVSLPERALAAQAPTIELVNLTQKVQERDTVGQFSDVLLQRLRETLARGEQAILFKNRRGFSPLLICENCGNIPRCQHCDIALTYHKNPAPGYLRCHYCGYTDNLVDQCSVCGALALRREGIGTERLEEQLEALFPEARIARMDMDTTRGKMGFHTLLTRLEAGEIDLLVGTQMVTKGLDVDNVTLVGVVQADQMLGFPDFRAHEQAYQVLCQFAGRAGRRAKQGLVIIQTRDPQHPVLQLLQQPYHVFAERELPLRAQHGYPPYGRLIRVEVRHKDRDLLEQEARRLAARLDGYFKGGLLGPEFPPIARLRSYYRQHLLIKLQPSHSSAVRRQLRQGIQEYYQSAQNKTLQIVVDVDPR